MNTEVSKWEVSDNEEDLLIYDVSPPEQKFDTTNNKKEEILTDNIDLYCPALPPNLTKKEHEHPVELTNLLPLSPQTLKKESEVYSESAYEKEPCFKDSELGRKVKNDIFIPAEKFHEEKITVINLDYSDGDKVSLEAKENFQYDQVAVITDARYVPLIKHLRRPGVIILSDENLQVVELEKYLPQDLDKSYSRTLFLLVIGVHSVTKQVPANYCKVGACNRPLQALNSFSDFDSHCAKFVNMVHSMLTSVRKSIPCHSKIAVLPPLPISLLTNYHDHKVMHSKQSQFPHYVIDNMGDAIAKWYPIWIDKILDISKSTLAACDFINMSVLDKLNDNDYKSVQVMNCRKGIDKPICNLWMKVVEDLIDNIVHRFPSNNIISQNLVTELKSNQNIEDANKVYDTSLLYAENTQNTTVAYDHLVFIGYAVSLKLIPEIFFTSYSQWHLDDTVAVANNFALQISALNSKSFKKVLFIILSDISMIGKEECNSECSLKHCEEAITYIKAPSDPNLYIKNINKYVDSLQKTVTEMKKYCNFQYKFIVAPFTPRIYVPISSIIFHRNMHNHLQNQVSTRFLRGSTKQIWNKIVNKFEEDWNRFMLDVLNENGQTNIHAKNIVSAYFQHCNSFIVWQDLFIDPLESECPAKSLWQSCLISLAVKGWMVLNDCTLLETKEDSQRTFNLHTMISEPVIPRKSIDIGDRSVTYDEVDTEVENALEESEIRKEKIYSSNADVLKFCKSILKEIKSNEANNRSTQNIKFKKVYIIGQKEVISPLFACNLTASFIYHKFVDFDDSDMNIILSKIGKFMENAICCLVFDITLITKEFMSSGCIKNMCQHPLVGTTLRIDNTDPMKELDQLISNQLKKVLKLTRTLSKHIQAIVLPLSPTRMYLDNDDSPCHFFSHKLLDMGCGIIYGSYSLWDIAVRSFILSWNNLMDLTNKSLGSSNCLTAYIKSNPDIFVITDNINDFTTHWFEHDVWKAVIELFLSSMVPLKKLPGVKFYSSYQAKHDKFYVSVNQVPKFLPTELFEKVFYCADRSVSITEKKGTFTLEMITLSRALLLVQKLNNFRIGDSVVEAVLVGNKKKEKDLELNLMQKLFISLSIDDIYNSWKPKIINYLTKKIDEVLNVAPVKSLPCEKGDSCRGPKVCIYYHSSSDKRRNPFLYHYSDVLCPKPKVHDECEDGDDCSFSHNAYEAKFHPSKYQVKVCPSRSLADICNSQDLCKFAHEDSPEMFFNHKWKDLVVFGLQNSLRYFAGAIRAASKIKDSKRCKLKVCFMSCSPEFIDILLGASINLYNTFRMKVCDVDNNLAESDTCQILIGNPSSFVRLSPSLFSDVFGAIIVDDVQTILNNGVHKESMQQFFQMVIKGSTNGILNNVFVYNTYDSKPPEIVGLTLKLVSSPEYNKSVVNLSTNLGQSSIQGRKRRKSSEDDTDVTKKYKGRRHRSRSHSSSYSKKYRRSRSRSESPVRSKKKRSRSRKKRTRNTDKCEEGNASSNKKVTPYSHKERKLAMEIVERMKIGYPPIKENHMTVFSTTLWVGHLPKSIGLDELSDVFGIFGEVETIDRISVRECAYVCMSKRQDAAKALKEVNINQFKNNSVIAWALGRGMKEKNFKDYWDASEGYSYIPHEDLYSMDDLDFNKLEKGGIIDDRTVPLSLKGYYEGKSLSILSKVLPVQSSYPEEWEVLNNSTVPKRTEKPPPCPLPSSLSYDKLHTPMDITDRTRNTDKWEKDKASSNKKVTPYSYEEKKIAIDMFRQMKSDYPPIKENHMTVYSTTLCVRHLPKSIGLDELSDVFGVFGEVKDINHLVFRGCAYIYMSKRQDAAKAMKEVKFPQKKNIYIIWAPGSGMREKNFKDYWEASEGCTYIPHEDLLLIEDLDFNELENGGVIDDRTVPLSLKGSYEGRSLSIQPVLPASKILPVQSSYPEEWEVLNNSSSIIPKRTEKLPQCPSPPSLSYDRLHTPMDIKDRNKDTSIRETDRRHKSIEEELRKDYPPNKEHHLTVYSTTLWVGSLSSRIDSRDLECVFNVFGKVLSIEVDHPNSCAYVCFASRQDAKAALINKNLKIMDKKVALTWAPGKGMQAKKFNDFWSMTLGCSYIPYNELVNMNIILETLEDGGWIDPESLKSWKSFDSSSILSSRSLHNLNIEDNSRHVSHRRSKSRSSERIDLRSVSVCSDDNSRITNKKVMYQDLSQDTSNIAAQKESRPSPSSLSAHSTVKLPFDVEYSEKLMPQTTGYDTLADLRKRFGSKLYEDYKLALANLSITFEKNFAIFYSVPELYPNYNKYYESFDTMYVVQHRGKNAQHKERLWNLYWKSVFDDIKNEEWEQSKNNIVTEFDARALNRFPLTQPPAFEQTYSSYSEAKSDNSYHELKDFQAHTSQKFPSTASCLSGSNFSLKENEDVPKNFATDKRNPLQSLGRDNSSFRNDHGNNSATQIPKKLTPIRKESYFPMMEQNSSHISKDSKEFKESAFSQACTSSEYKNISDCQDVLSRGTPSSILINEPDNTNQRENSIYSFTETISLIERLSDDVGFLGPSIKVLIKTCKELGTTTKAAYNIFADSENLMLIGMVTEKFKSLYRSATGYKHHLYEKVINWIPKLLEDAKKGPTIKIEDIKIDIEAIGKASLGKEPKFALDMIKMTLAYEGINDPPKEMVNDLFLKVCAIHFNMSME